MGEKKGFFSRLVSGLTKTRKNIASGLEFFMDSQKLMMISMRN